MNSPAIIIPCFNREKSLLRLLSFLVGADYPSSNVSLVISVDGGGTRAVCLAAETFQWPHGPKEVIVHRRNLGLREHILTCGDLAERYGSIILLEDDLGVSRFFYQYAVAALGHFAKHPAVAGISLYKHLINVNCQRRFEPLDSGLGYYFMQFPQSWGQLWTWRQWREFRAWYDNARNREKRVDIPTFVQLWPESSWLKYFAKYVVDRQKFFVYPMKSMSTNFNDPGTHVDAVSNTFQVPLAELCPRLQVQAAEDPVRYDTYFEMDPSSFSRLAPGLPEEIAALDLYGIRDLDAFHDADLILTVRPCRRYLKQWGFQLKPREMNIILNLSGSTISLARKCDIQLPNPHDVLKREFLYDRHWLGMRAMLRLAKGLLYEKLIG
jgi:glycosyltransferase involved in cell wall biosynthesis